MIRKLSPYLLFAMFTLFSIGATAQYSPSRAMNEISEDVEFDFIGKDGKKQRRVERRKVAADKYGNAAGNKHDLAVDGAFEGQTVAVLHLYTGEGFDFALPKAALAEKGFSTYRWMNQPPPVAELKAKLAKACQLWIISSDARLLSDAHVAVIKEFFDSGKGVYVWGDNEPYYADANVVAQALIGSGMDGNLWGDKVVTLQAPNAKGKAAQIGLLPGHDLTTGIEQLYEGVTIATLRPTDDLKPLLYGSAGNLVTGIYEKNGKRLVVDGGFTRLFINWDTAGTSRYVKNAAAWLVNYERFGDDVLGEKIRKEKQAAFEKAKADKIKSRKKS